MAVATALRETRTTTSLAQSDALGVATRASTRRPRRLVWRVLRGTISALSLLAMVLTAVGAVGLAALSTTGKYRTAMVLTGSMANLYPPGTVVLLQEQPARSLRVNDVVAFTPPQAAVPVIHRVIKIVDENQELRTGDILGQQDASEGAGPSDTVAQPTAKTLMDLPGLDAADSDYPLLITKGDTNPLIDSWSPMKMGEDKIFKPIGVIPYGRYILETFSNPTIFRTVGALAMVLIGWPLLARIWLGKPGSTGGGERDWEDWDDPYADDDDDDSLMYPPDDWFDDSDLTSSEQDDLRYRPGRVTVPSWDFEPVLRPTSVRERILARVRSSAVTSRDILGPVSLGFTIRRAIFARRRTVVS